MGLYDELTVIKYGKYFFYMGSRSTYANKIFAPNELLVRTGFHLESYVSLIDAGIDPILGDYTRIVMRGIYMLTTDYYSNDKSIWHDYFMNGYSLDLVVAISQTDEIFRIPFDNEAYDLVCETFVGREHPQLTHESIPDDELAIRDELFELSRVLVEKRRKTYVES